MSDELLVAVLGFVQNLEWSSSDMLTSQSQEQFLHGLDIVDSYRGHPQVLVDALEVFQAIDSRPYAYAGVAYVLMSAAYLSDDDYLASGLDEAHQWLRRAQALAPDRPEINVLEAMLYINAKDPWTARKILDRLPRTDVPRFRVCLAEMRYGDSQHNLAHVESWYIRAIAVAASASQRLQLLNWLAACYHTHHCWEKAIKIHHDMAELDPNDPWLWHNLSLAYYHLQQYKAAHQANKNALSLMDFGAARAVQQALQKKRSWWGWR